MSTENEDTPVITELDLLKSRAKQMGINFHPSIGLDKLRNKVAAKQNGEPDPDAAADVKPVKLSKAAARKDQLEKLRKDAAKLIRIQVSCMNPDKKEWDGEVYTVSNSVVGTYKKYVPFNAENGWHVPNIIYKHMLERECQIFQTIRNERGQKVRKGKLIKELNIRVLPDLTPAELADLAQRQAMAVGTAAA